MSVISKSPRILLLLAMLTGTASASLAAQQKDPSDADISAAVYSSPSPEAAEMAEGPEIEGIISARSGDGMQVTTADGTNTVIAINDATRIKASGGFLGLSRNKLAADALLNGLPVSVETLPLGGRLVGRKGGVEGKSVSGGGNS